MRDKINKVLSCTIILFTLGACSNSEQYNFDEATLNLISENIPYANNYDGHLQGFATDFQGHIYWSHTRQLVKTNLNGEILKVIDVQNHHGDLEYYQGKIYVAVNFGKFNEEPGLADSWVYIYDAKDLSLLAKHATPEVVHGAGGIAIHNNRAMLVGGLPEKGDYKVNYVYEYNMDFDLVKRHDLKSGYTYKGIQTACYFNNYWYFACYGSERVGVVPKVLKVKEAGVSDLEFVESIDLDMSYGMIGLKGNEFLFCNRNLKNETSKMKIAFNN